MRTVFSTLSAGSALATGLLLACGSGSDAGVGGFTADAADAQNELSQPSPSHPVADDGGVADATPVDARPPYDAAAPPVACAVTPCMKKLIAGPGHYCAVGDDGLVRCWGRPEPLGVFADAGPDADPGATPVVLDGLADVADIAANTLNTCVAHTDGGMDCVGADTPTPTRVSNVPNATKISISDERNCAVLGTGELFCWGNSAILGSTDTTTSLEGEQARDVQVNTSVAFAIGTKGTLFSWGSDPDVLGRQTPYFTDLAPAPVDVVPAIRQLAASDNDACALAEDGRLFCWGNGFGGGLGLGFNGIVPTPTEVLFAGVARPTQIAVATSHTCARMTDGSLDCWTADNTYGVLGYDAKIGVYVPTKVSGLAKPVVSVATGTSSTCVLSIDGSVQCWGDNKNGQLGLGVRDTLRHYVPTTVVFPR